CLVIVFGNQIWAMAQGFALPRSFGDYKTFNTPLWSYACPTGLHALGRAFPSSWYASTGLLPKLGECCSYLGVVALVLLAYALALGPRSGPGRARGRGGRRSCDRPLLPLAASATAGLLCLHAANRPGRGVRRGPAVGLDRVRPLVDLRLLAVTTPRAHERGVL